MNVTRVHEVGVSAPTIAGVAEIRDKDGNLKGTFTFGGPISSVEKAEELYEQMKGDGNGCHSNDSGT